MAEYIKPSIVLLKSGKYRVTYNPYGEKTRLEYFDTLEEAQKSQTEFWANYTNNKDKQRADMIGKKFGKLVVVKYIGLNKHDSRIWQCKCACGNLFEATTGQLTSGSVVTCGSTEHRIERIMPTAEKNRKEIEELGTLHSILKSKKRIDNRSGYKGVFLKTDKKGVTYYMAKLTVKGKTYRGSPRKTAELAYQDRLEMEEKYHKPILDAYNKSQGN